jgi:hypothetical protein
VVKNGDGQEVLLRGFGKAGVAVEQFDFSTGRPTNTVGRPVSASVRARAAEFDVLCNAD